MLSPSFLVNFSQLTSQIFLSIPPLTLSLSIHSFDLHSSLCFFSFFLLLLLLSHFAKFLPLFFHYPIYDFFISNFISFFPLFSIFELLLKTFFLFIFLLLSVLQVSTLFCEKIIPVSQLFFVSFQWYFRFFLIWPIVNDSIHQADWSSYWSNDFFHLHDMLSSCTCSFRFQSKKLVDVLFDFIL